MRQERNNHSRALFERHSILWRCAPRIVWKRPPAFGRFFVGVPEGDPHYSESQRRTLNSAALEVINVTGAFHAFPIDVLDAAELIVRYGSSDRFHETLIARHTASAIIVFEPRWPTIDAVQLNVVLIGRGAAGTYGCNESFNLHIEPGDLTISQRPRVDFNLSSVEGGINAAATGLFRASGQSSESRPLRTRNFSAF